MQFDLYNGNEGVKREKWGQILQVLIQEVVISF